ncbi:unnamed protein product [Meloidogyne enterolobii]|uniref:Uncharacterized protein n=1 Tax=Meloidogyne enterolobii TaxID=390850 RepID=A0ACB1ASR1_MELEN
MENFSKNIFNLVLLTEGILKRHWAKKRHEKKFFFECRRGKRRIKIYINKFIIQTITSSPSFHSLPSPPPYPLLLPLSLLRPPTPPPDLALHPLPFLPRPFHKHVYRLLKTNYNFFLPLPLSPLPPPPRSPFIPLLPPFSHLPPTISPPSPHHLSPLPPPSSYPSSTLLRPSPSTPIPPSPPHSTPQLTFIDNKDYW